MSGPRTDNGFTVLESKITGSLSIDGLLTKAEQVGPSLVLRELAREGRFLSTITCRPGEIVLLDAEEKLGNSVRHALLGNSSDTPFSVRYGARELHSSEILNVGLSHSIWNEGTAYAALRASGAPARVAEELLVVTGIEAHRNTPPKQLDEDVIRCLAICRSFFSPANVLLYHAPFAPIAPERVEAIAELMLQAAQSTMRIFIVTDAGKIPECWRLSNIVRHARVESGDGNRPLEKTSDGLLDSMRSMMHSARDIPGHRGYIVTRPQTIHMPPAHTASNEAMQVEAIANPEVGPATVGEESADIAHTSPSDTQAMRLLKHGNVHLTKVSLWQRLLRDSPVVRSLSQLKQNWEGFKRTLTAEDPEELLGSAKLKKYMREHARESRFRYGVLRPLSIIVVALMLLQLFFLVLTIFWG